MGTFVAQAHQLPKARKNVQEIITAWRANKFSANLASTAPLPVCHRQRSAQLAPLEKSALTSQKVFTNALKDTSARVS